MVLCGRGLCSLIDRMDGICTTMSLCILAFFSPTQHLLQLVYMELPTYGIRIKFSQVFNCFAYTALWHFVRDDFVRGQIVCHSLTITCRSCDVVSR